jgi:hypothetical protein
MVLHICRVKVCLNGNIFIPHFAHMRVFAFAGIGIQRQLEVFTSGWFLQCGYQLMLKQKVEGMQRIILLQCLILFPYQFTCM